MLSAHHQSQVLRAALPKLRRFGLKVTLIRESKPLGTGGAIRFAWPDPGQPCLVLNGDILTDLDLGPLSAAHLASGAAATLWSLVVEQTPPAFGSDRARIRPARVHPAFCGEAPAGPEPQP